jgi:elongation factor P
MPKINANDWKKGLKIILDGDPFEMIDLEFRKPGKGQALYSVRLRNLLTGTILTPTYRSGDSLESADVRKTNGQYLYREANGYVFMDTETYEQYTLPKEGAEDKVKFLLDGAMVELLFWDDRLIDMMPSSHVVLEVTYTEPAARGNTATNVTKPATVETGAIVQVPAFISEGEKIKIDARTGDYIERSRD